MAGRLMVKTTDATEMVYHCVAFKWCENRLNDRLDEQCSTLVLYFRAFTIPSLELVLLVVLFRTFFITN